MNAPSTIPILRRISVVGCSGVGKSTFARALAERLGVPHIEIDALHHGPNWKARPRDLVRQQVSDIIAKPAWVFDGNYGSTCGDLVRGAADTVIWLDYSRFLVMRSIVARSVSRAWNRTELWNGNRERWVNLVDPRPSENVILWAATRFGAYRRQYAAESADPRLGTTWVRLRSRAAASAWLDSLPRH